MKHQRAYRAVFLAAGIYNILWGINAVANPQWFFRLTGLPPSNTPQIFATLGMVLALYGILYLDVARRPTQGWLVAAVALTGKILGPLGLAYLIVTGTWPASTVILVLTNDLIWWIPFACYLRDAWPAFRSGKPHHQHTLEKQLCTPFSPTRPGRAPGPRRGRAATRRPAGQGDRRPGGGGTCRTITCVAGNAAAGVNTVDDRGEGAMISARSTGP